MDLLLAHPYKSTDAELAAMSLAVARFAGPGDTLTLGRDDHFRNFKLCGSWDNWALSIAERFDGIVLVPDTAMTVGRPTAGIAQYVKAHEKSLAVLLADPNAPGGVQLAPVADVVDTGHGRWLVRTEF